MSAGFQLLFKQRDKHYYTLHDTRNTLILKKNYTLLTKQVRYVLNKNIAFFDLLHAICIIKVILH